MRTKLFIVVALVATLALMVASPAFAGQQTRILYGQENYDVYEVTPASDGYMRVEVSWTRADGTGAPLWPEPEVDGVVQSDDGVELYMDLDWADLYLGTNPQVHTAAVTGGQIYYVSVAPFTGDVPYRLRCLYDSKSNGTFATVLLDTGAINISSPTQKWAYGVNGNVYVPEAGPWHSVLQYWPGSLGTSAATSDVYANWDDYVFTRDDYATIVSNWAGLEYYPPVVTDETITTQTDAQYYTVCPEIWTAAARPNVWNDYGFDAYPKPGSLTWSGANSAPLWYTYSFPDSTKNANVSYMWGVVGNASASKRAYTADASTTSSVKASFYGTSITWVYRTSSLGGRANIFIDGSATPYNADPIELYSTTTQYGQTYPVTGLTDAAHTIEVKNAGTKTTASGSYYVYHDAFIAKTDAADPITNGRLEGNEDGSTLHDWPRVSNTSASGGSYSASPSTAASCAFTFNGTAVTLVYRTGALGGRANVYIDGVKQGTSYLEMYSAATAWQVQQAYTGLPAGWHTIFIKNEGTKSAASGSYYVYVDAFKVGATTVEN